MKKSILYSRDSHPSPSHTHTHIHAHTHTQSNNMHTKHTHMELELRLIFMYFSSSCRPIYTHTHTQGRSTEHPFNRGLFMLAAFFCQWFDNHPEKPSLTPLHPLLIPLPPCTMSCLQSNYYCYLQIRLSFTKIVFN